MKDKYKFTARFLSFLQSREEARLPFLGMFVTEQGILLDSYMEISVFLSVSVLPQSYAELSEVLNFVIYKRKD